MSQYFTYDSNLRDRNKFTSTVETTFGTKRYFSSLDTEVYFGQKQVDEIVAIDFTMAEPKLPIYGYNSFYPNRMVSGRRTVQGTFAINFTHTMYLLNILNSINDSIISNDYEALVYRCPEEDTTGLGIGNSAIFSKRFDITISYGYGKSENPTYNGCYQTLVGVQIVDYRQALDTNGEPILDMYSFIAKDIRYDGSITPISDEDNGGGEIIEESIQIINGDIETSTNKDKPIFSYHPQLYQKGSEYFLSLKMDVIKNNSEVSDTFKNVNFSVTEKSLGVNFSHRLSNLKAGTTQEIPLTGSLREAAAKLMKDTSGTDDKHIDFHIEFSANIDSKDSPLSDDSTLIILI